MDEDQRIQHDNVDEALEQGTFSFASVAYGRNYPHDTITIYMNEDILYRHKIALKNKDADQAKALESELSKSAYLFKLVGISSERREQLDDESRVKFPVKYEQYKNFQNGSLEKREAPDEQREKYFRDLLTAAHVEQIVAPDGSVDTAPGVIAATAFRTHAPLGEQLRFQQKLAEMAVSSGDFEQRADATFPGGSSDMG